MSQQIWENKVALVTGASSGIGWETARFLSEKGIRVAITARREKRLEALAATIRGQGGAVLVLPADLQNPEERKRVYTEVIKTWGPIDLLINNAGFGWGEAFAEMEWETMQSMLDVNIVALLHLTRLALPQMVARGQGWVINIASIAGDLPTPPLSLYCATKSMVQAISEALYREVGRQGVHVSVVNPGPIATEFGAMAYGWSVEKATHKGTPASAVAEAIWWAISRRRKRVYVPWYFRSARWVNLVFEFLVDWLHPIVINTLRRDQQR